MRLLLSGVVGGRARAHALDTTEGSAEDTAHDTASSVSSLLRLTSVPSFILVVSP